MTKEEILDKVRLFDREHQVRWMINLGMQFTIAARDGYPIQEKPGNLQRLVGFNEMQHQIYGRIRLLNRGEEWTNESFLDGLLEKAKHYELGGGFDWALSSSLQDAH